jgi:hypothetical protein
MMVALDTSLMQPTIAAIDAAVVAAEPRDFDHVVRGSSIGKCERHLFYRFRWAHAPDQFDGRMLRLFHTGHAEEARMIAWLGMAGARVAATDPDTGEQWEVVALDGHFAGHLDGIVASLWEAPATPHLLECKTHNAKSFEQLRRHGVAIAKPEHVDQMQIYMHLKGLTRAFYLAKNKDTDELWSERIHYDAAHGTALLAKAARIKDAHAPPSRVSDDPASFLCRFCSSHAVCHEGAFALRNCRTCIYSTPVAGGAWHCERHDRDLTIDDQRVGCPNHLYLPGLVPGEQIDADEAAESVTYALSDGRTWIDGARHIGVTGGAA